MEIEENGLFNKMKQSRSEDEFSDRIGFIRKVFGILTVQLLITACFTLLPTLNENTRVWMKANRWLVWTSFALAFVIQCAILCV